MLVSAVRVTQLLWRFGLREHVARLRRESLARGQELQSAGRVLPRDSFQGVGIHGSLGFQGSPATSRGAAAAAAAALRRARLRKRLT